MEGLESFIFAALALAWAVYQVIRRALKPPRPLGTIQDEGAADEPPQAQVPQVPPAPREPVAAREQPFDIGWGRSPQRPAPPRAEPPVPMPAPVAGGEYLTWGRDASQGELAAARAMARRQEARRVQQEVPRAWNHPRRPRLHTAAGLRQAVVAAAVVGPCRAMDPYRPPD
jgi:hypothetical protein